jgi:hypothetical protein
MAAPSRHPYVKLAATLMLLGMGLFTLERYGLGRLGGEGEALHLDPTVLSLLVLAPVLLVAAGALVFVVGKLRRL